MPKLVSLDEKLTAIEELIDGEDLNEWENDFVKSVSKRVAAFANNTTCLSEKQVNVIERIYLRLFG